MKISKLFLLLLFPVIAFAQDAKIIHSDDSSLTVEVTQIYVLGDGDTKIDARNIALQQAKIKAAEAAGSYVEAQRVVQDDEIKSETIKTISTALMKSKIKDERFSITNANQMQLELTLISELDKNSILNKLGTLKQDNEKLQQMGRIQEENKRLQEELAALNKQIAQLKDASQTATISAKPRQELVQRRDEVFAEIQKNQNSISAIFEKGTLFSMAQKSNQELEQAQKDIEVNVWGYIVNNTKVTLGEPDFIQNSDGTYNIRIEVKWRMDERPLLNTLNKYFTDYSGGHLPDRSSLGHHMGRSVPGTEIRKLANINESQLKAYTGSLYKFLLTKRASIKVSAKNYSTNIVIASPRGCFVSCSGITGDDQYQIHFNNFSNPKVTINDENPIIIKNIPQSVLESLTAIDAKVILQ